MSKEDAIIEAATRLFLSKGFSGVSMEEIAKGSSVAKQTLYSYFKGKDDLFRAIIKCKCAFCGLRNNAQSWPEG